jgi:hypothetical protein
MDLYEHSVGDDIRIAQSKGAKEWSEKDERRAKKAERNFSANLEGALKLNCFPERLELR